MTLRLVIEEPDRTRTIEPGAFPLPLGGPNSALALEGASPRAPIAYLGQVDDEIFLQPEPAHGTVLCNGQPVTSSRWLRHGDRIGVGPVVATLIEESDRMRLAVESRRSQNTPLPPDASGPPPRVAPPPRAPSTVDAERVAPIDFQPKGSLAPARSRRLPGLSTIAAFVGLALLAAAAWFIFSAGTLELAIEPAPENLTIQGGLPAIQIGGRWIARPGSYTVTARKEGYRNLEETIEVSADSDQRFSFALLPLPGLLSVGSGVVTGARVSIDGAPVGATPLADFELEPGRYEVRVEAERHEGASATVTIEGSGSSQRIDVELRPLWAPVALSSVPAGARVRVDGREIGSTPLSAELLEGTRTLEFLLPGHYPGRKRVEVKAGEALAVPAVRMRPSDGNLLVVSDPDAADITIDGAYRGRTPLDLELAPAKTYTVLASKVGYESRSEEVRVESGAAREVKIDLEPIEGEVKIASRPSGAEVWIDGAAHGTTPLTVRLPAVPHEVELRLEGHESSRHTVTPRKEFLQAIDANLRSDEQVAEEARIAATPEVATGPQGQSLKLIEGGRFTMGASRREPGRRANETLREVQLTRRFYLATQEVSNRQFREFRSSHKSGSVSGHNLEIDHHPVVRVTWNDAVRYCNWLSSKEGLPPAYSEVDGKMIAASPMNLGYRLPTEAEWVWAARYPTGGAGLKYPWGPSLPVQKDSGNYADVSARGLLPSVLNEYDDRFATTSPIDSYAPNPLGIFNLGGNVAEWIHDFYGIAPPGSDQIARDPLGPSSGEYHVIRGSSWMHSTVSELRISYRDYGVKPRADLGFRVARYAE